MAQFAPETDPLETDTSMSDTSGIDTPKTGSSMNGSPKIGTHNGADGSNVNHFAEFDDSFAGHDMYPLPTPRPPRVIPSTLETDDENSLYADCVFDPPSGAHLTYPYNFAREAESPRNITADIPLEQNCSFVLLCLPSGTDADDILSQICYTGRVFWLAIKQPRRKQRDAVAKLTFFKVDAAQKFLSWAGPNGPGLFVNGRRAVVAYNRVAVAEQVGDIARRSRVLALRGDPTVVNKAAVMEHLDRAKLKYYIQGFSLKEYADGSVRLIVVMASYRGQAEPAFDILSRAMPGVMIWYERDPCEAKML